MPILSNFTFFSTVYLGKWLDALVMGRRTFEKVLTFGDWSYDKPVFVLSKSMTELPEDMV
jgi:dihydrofolate reductase